MRNIKQDYFLNRSSCRYFSDTPLSINKIEEIIGKAMKAPTCGNMQLYSVVITTDTKNKDKLATLHYNQPASTTAPIILTVCADYNRFTRWCDLSDADPGCDNIHCFLTAMTDAIILTQQIVTIAEMEGLGTCYLGTVVYNAKEIAKLLELPKLVVPVASISIGYPEKPGEETLRLPLSAIIHKEKYRKDSNQQILDFYKAEEENAMNIKFMNENGKDKLAQVFTDIRYPRSTNEMISKTFMDFIKLQGFNKNPQ